jgi:hypothetical protein
MARAQSYNWELDIGGDTVYPKVVGEFSPRENGLLEVTDGDRKYSIDDQISAISPVEIDVLIKKGLVEVKILEAAAKAAPQDMFLIGRDGAGAAALTYLFSACGVTVGKKSGSDRSSKAEEIQKFMLLPEDIERVD